MTAPTFTGRQPFRLTPEQYDRLTMALEGSRVGKNPKGFSHMEAWDIRRWLIRVFGFGAFDIETTELAVVREIEIKPMRNGEVDPTGKSRWTVVYRAQVRLTIRDQFGGHVVLEDGACGDSSNQPALGDCHDNAAKTALSQALKRCAVNLGDCFGLSLYNDGATRAVVVRSIVAPEPPAAGTAAAVLPVDDAPVMPEPGSAPAAEEPTTAEQPPAPEPAPTATSSTPTARGPRATQLLKQVQDATDKDSLAAAWKALAAADKACDITKPESDHLAGEWRTHKEHLVPSNPATEAQHKHMHALFRDAEVTEREARLNWTSTIVGRDISSSKQLSKADANKVIDRVQAYIAQNTPPASAEGPVAA